METELDAEHRILEAAKNVFMQKGLDSSTMQDIANEASISRPSLHYYYRSKDKLFEMVLSKILDTIMPKVAQSIYKDIPFTDKIIEISINYIDMIYNNSQMPGFMLSEIRRNPDRIAKYIMKKWIAMDFDFIEKQKKIEIEKGIIRPFETLQLVVLIGGLCAFPFACKPLLDSYPFDDSYNFDDFIEERKRVVSEVISGWLLVK